MTSLLFGLVSNQPVPVDEAVVRNTAVPVEMDAPPAEAQEAPDPNQVETDPNPHLGMVNRTLASTWTQGERETPSWIPLVDQNYQHNALINKQVGSSGQAAAKEATGRWGHGSLSFAEGIEPVGDLAGGRFGNEYFEANEAGGNRAAGNYMLPISGDQSLISQVDATAKLNERAASSAGMYDSFYKNLMGMSE